VNTLGNQQGYFIGDALTYVDIAVFHVISAAEFQFPSVFVTISDKIPLLLTHKLDIANLPRIKSYLSSDRRGFFSGNSMM
jgi:glutathione S-transferase